MSRMQPPPLLRKIFQLLFCGNLGEAACRDLDHEYLKLRTAKGSALAWLWYAGHLLTPSTWTLAYKLRQRKKRRLNGTSPGSSARLGGGWWMDVKLGLRILRRYPGLTLVAGLAIAFAISIGAGAFEYIRQMVHPSLPLEEGDRVVGIQNWDTAAGRVEQRAMLDFLLWREQATSVEDLGAFRTYERNLLTEDRRSEPVEVAEISPSAFRLARVAPLLGRSLSEPDGEVGAPPVMVIGYRLWKSRFEGDPGAVGRTVQLGSTSRTVVGVMPEDFAFPVAHSLWIPLQAGLQDRKPRQGPAVWIFARLAPGVSLGEAQAELTAIGLRTASDYPDSHGRLRPVVLPYAKSITNFSWQGMWINALFILLVVLVSSNVALLMFARTVTRQGELVLRSALGASRRRIMTQLFLEALVLAGVAAAAGLAAARFALSAWLSVEEADAGRPLPFWLDDSLGPATILYAVTLTLLVAGIVGIVPALQVTGRNMETRLRQALPRAGGPTFGGLWTWVIVIQVAVTVVVPSTAFFAQRYVDLTRSVKVAFPEQEFLSARLELDPPASPAASAGAQDSQSRLPTAYLEFERRLEADSAVAGVTFANRLPRSLHPRRTIEVDGQDSLLSDSAARHPVAVAAVGVDFFSVLEAPVLSGRGFRPSDLEAQAGAVMVNQSFVHRVLDGRNPIGRRVRYAAPAGQEPGPWHEIIGVVGDLGTILLDGDPRDDPGLYHPSAVEDALAVFMAVRVKGEPLAFAERFRETAAATNPALRLHEILPLNKVGADLWTDANFLSKLLALISGVAVILSLAAIYSIMSFTVTRRTREIGIRIALGSGRLRVLTEIFRRPMGQVAIGVLAGSGMVALLVKLIMGSVSASEAGLVSAYAALMLGVCALACIVPTRRALRIEPTEALKDQ